MVSMPVRSAMTAASPICMVLAICRPRNFTGSPSWKMVCPCDPINSILRSGTPVSWSASANSSPNRKLSRAMVPVCAAALETERIAARTSGG
jgi:hypothetical protein